MEEEESDVRTPRPGGRAPEEGGPRAARVVRAARRERGLAAGVGERRVRLLRPEGQLTSRVSSDKPG